MCGHKITFTKHAEKEFVFDVTGTSFYCVFCGKKDVWDVVNIEDPDSPLLMCATCGRYVVMPRVPLHVMRYAEDLADTLRNSIPGWD